MALINHIACIVVQPTQINADHADHADRRRYSYVNLSKLAKIILNERLSVSQDSPFENTGVSEFIDLDIQGDSQFNCHLTPPFSLDWVD